MTKIFISRCLVMSFSLFLVSCHFKVPIQSKTMEEKKKPTSSIPLKARLKEKDFYTGVYIYIHRMNAAAKSFGRTYADFMDEHLGILKKKGINAVYLGGVFPENFDMNLRLAEKHEIKIIPQLNFAYFKRSWSEKLIIKKAKLVADFVKKYKNNPYVLAWSVKEEPRLKDLKKLSLYYTKILEFAPKTKLFLLNSMLNSAKKLEKPIPAILGADIYPFFWEYSGGGYLASPEFALSYLRGKAKAFFEEAEKRNRDFFLILTSDALANVSMANKIATLEKITFIPEEQREKFATKCNKFADDGRMGWGKFEKDGKIYYNAWKWYHPPRNCTKAMIWTGIMTGAKSIFFWMYSPASKEDLKKTFASVSSQKRSEVFLSPMGEDLSKIDPEFEEYSETIKEIYPYGDIIINMSKLPISSVKSTTRNIFNNSFSYLGIKGKIVVLYNANVGTWPTNKRFFGVDDKIYIDSGGNLKGFKAFTKATEAFLEIDLRENEKLFDLATGKVIPQEENDFRFIYPVRIMPGSGKLLFIGSKDEFLKLYNLVR